MKVKVCSPWHGAVSLCRPEVWYIFTAATLQCHGQNFTFTPSDHTNNTVTSKSAAYRPASGLKGRQPWDASTASFAGAPHQRNHLPPHAMSPSTEKLPAKRSSLSQANNLEILKLKAQSPADSPHYARRRLISSAKHGDITWPYCLTSEFPQDKNICSSLSGRTLWSIQQFNE